MVSVMNRADRKSWSSLSSRPFSPTEVSTRQQGRCGPSSLLAFLLNKRNWYLLVIIMVGRPPYPERSSLTSSASSRRRVCDPVHSLFLPAYMSVPSVVSVSRSSLVPKSLCLTHRRVEPGSSVCVTLVAGDGVLTCSLAIVHHLCRSLYRRCYPIRLVEAQVWVC
jgi:hypothetical protein